MNRDSTEKLSVTPTVEFPNLKAEKFLEKRINEDQSVSIFILQIIVDSFLVLFVAFGYLD